MTDFNVGLSADVSAKIEEFEKQGKTSLILSDRKNILGVIAVSDALKETAKETVEKLKKLGLEVWLITGDNEETAKTIAQKVGIEKVMASVLPEQKRKR